MKAILYVSLIEGNIANVRDIFTDSLYGTFRLNIDDQLDSSKSYGIEEIDKLVEAGKISVVWIQANGQQTILLKSDD